MYHQEQLDTVTFPNTEIRIKADYAATAELKAKWMKTCEHPTTANQLVVLVLHSPKLRLDNGQPRQVVCDYWRMWTNAKANCQGWHLFLDRIVSHYKATLPSLNAVGIWTDGSSTQFKGAKNFMLNVDFYRKHGIELTHTPVFSSLTLSFSSRTAVALIDGSRVSHKAAFLLISAACESIRDNRYRRRVVKSSRVPKLLTARVCTSLRRKRGGGSSSSG